MAAVREQHRGVRQRVAFGLNCLRSPHPTVSRMHDIDQTIVAVASPLAAGVRGIVRVSGSDTIGILQTCFVCDRPWDASAASRSYCGDLLVAEPLNRIPIQLLLWPTRRSYTRQVSAELHLPGGPPLIDAALQALCRAGARLAAPGEFTWRAFLAGRIDLTQAEAVLAVVESQSREQLESALRQLAGGLAAPLAALRQRLLLLLADLEAGLDFVDEDIEFVGGETIDSELRAASQQLEQLQRQMASRHEGGELPRIVLFGEPNVGKSSLLNALAGGAASPALTSATPGTTRDYLTRHIRWRQLEWLLVDTAGIWDPAAGPRRSSSDPSDPSDSHLSDSHLSDSHLSVSDLSDLSDSPSLGRLDLEQAAVRQTEAQCSRASVAVLCLDATRTPSAWERQQMGRPQAFVVWTKADAAAAPRGALAVSAHSGAGLTELREEMARRLSAVSTGGGALISTAARSRDATARAAEAVGRARCAAADRLGDEIVAWEIRLALDELGQVAGEVHNEEVLDHIFSRFCIGK